jgi:predicted outer membrane repeat protein
MTNLLADFGGGIFLDKAASAFLKACNVTASEAKFGGALEIVQDSNLLANSTIFAANTATVGGGAIHMERSTATLEDCLSEKNFANSQGGAIYASKRSLLQGHRNVYFENEATEEAGALYVGQASWWHSAEPFFLEKSRWHGRRCCIYH